ncbi:MAG: hypothetical protein V3V56_11425 [bacterium]
MQAAVRTIRIESALAALVTLWFLTILGASLGGAFYAGGGRPPVALLAAVALPIAAFVGAYRTSVPFREFVLALDPRKLALIHTTRVIGAVFLVLYLQGLLPGRFALPAGWGDVAAAAAAPLAVRALASGTAWGRRAFAAWNLFGLADFAVAVFMGAVVPILMGAPASGADAGIMRLFPLVLIPGFAVPFLIILHLISLAQLRNRAGEGGAPNLPRS